MKRITVAFPDELANEIDAWMASIRLKNDNEAIRRLVIIGLDVELVKAACAEKTASNE